MVISLFDLLLLLRPLLPRKVPPVPSLFFHIVRRQRRLHSPACNPSRRADRFGCRRVGQILECIKLDGVALLLATCSSSTTRFLFLLLPSPSFFILALLSDRFCRRPVVLHHRAPKRFLGSYSVVGRASQRGGQTDGRTVAMERAACHSTVSCIFMQSLVRCPRASSSSFK